MRHLVDSVLLAEARTFSLRFACEDCVHHDAERDRCTHGYTERPSPGDLEPGSPPLAFCKEFELGGEQGA
jgi:hypothetical protein